MFLGINYILKLIEQANLSETLYAWINQSALWIMLVFYFFYRKMHRIHWLKALIAAYLLHQCVSYGASFTMWAEAGFTSSYRGNYAAGFMYAPLGCWLLSVLLRVPCKKLGDFLAPVPLIMHGFFRIACIMAGCCRGIPADWGIYNTYYGTYDFPVTFLEALISFGITGYLIWRFRRNRCEADGKSMSLMLILYGTARFITEFLRVGEKILLGLSVDSFHAMLMCAVGTVILLCMRRTSGSKQPSPKGKG